MRICSQAPSGTIQVPSRVAFRSYPGTKPGGQSDSPVNPIVLFGFRTIFTYY